MDQNRAKLPQLVGMASRERDQDHEESGEFPSATEGSGPASCSSPRWPARAVKACAITDQQHRVRLINDISKLLHDPCVPDSAKAAGLTLIGWLARRQPGEDAHGYGVAEAQRARSARRR